ncbi:NAD-dependent epimerase/dehydratase family protein [Chroococcidiopsis sp.]|uniref:NAD-dependent epimerase/dehydratase family protein n=1 Tax=Chroococcidiopsis sp. TaxID=3088168 RepID=UPI003F3DCBC7
MKILVTDPEGYVGSLVVACFTQQGHEAISVSQANGGAALSLIELAVTDLQNFDAVIHTGEICGNPALHPQIACNIHYRDAMHLANLAKAAGVSRFIYLSSCSVYGAGEEEYVTEESPVRPQTPSAICKAAIESDLLTIASAEFSPTILRPAIAFGASPRIRFDVVLNNMAGLAWTANKINIPGKGLSWCPVVHVLDICQIINCILQAPRSLVHQQIFNVGDTNHNYQLIEIAAMVAEVFQVENFSFGHNGFGDRGLFMTFDKIHQFFPDFQCGWNPRQGAEQLLNFFTLTDSIQSHFTLARSPHRQPENYPFHTASIA